MTRPRHDEDFLPMNEERDGTTDDESDSLFDESDNNTDDTEDTEVLPDESDSDSDDEAWLFDDVCKRPPEYDRAEAENLDVQRLRQRRYSPKTQDRLDWVKDHFHR
jgi:DNA-nicking Smr family endonuclease